MSAHPLCEVWPPNWRAGPVSRKPLLASGSTYPPLRALVPQLLYKTKQARLKSWVRLLLGMGFIFNQQLYQLCHRSGSTTVIIHIKTSYLKSKMNVFLHCLIALDYFLLKTRTTTTIFRARKMLKVAGSLRILNTSHKTALLGPTRPRAA